MDPYSILNSISTPKQMVMAKIPGIIQVNKVYLASKILFNTNFQI